MVRTINSHISEENFKWPIVVSTSGHFLLFLFFILATDLLPAGEPIVIGSGDGGGQGGDFITVGLSAQLGGGAGMYKPALTPQAAVAPTPPERKPAAETVQPAPEEKIFVQKTTRRQQKSSTTPAPKIKNNSAPVPGAIPRVPDPGIGGPGGSSTGSGGGFGSGRGVTIGSGTGEGVMDSWYIRQVEQRVGQNWLKTSLGQLGRSVQTVVSFEIRPNGEITQVEIDRSSGISSVDLAAERAVRASNPLPPLPREFRNNRVKFVAHFDYPPR